MACHFTACAAIVFLFCSAAEAAQTTVAGDDPVINRTDCRALATYRPSQGVDYQPGVDVNGHYVAPADLPGGSTYKLPETVEFDVRIDPIGYAQRNAAQHQIAQTSQSIVQNQAGLKAAQAKQTQLSQQLASLQATQTNLNTQQAGFTAQIAAATAQITAQTGGATPTAQQLNTRNIEIAGATTVITGSASYQSLQSQIAANTQALTSTGSAITANNGVIAAAPGTATDLQTSLTGAQGQAAAVSGQFDNTSMSVGHVVVNTKTGAVTMDGKPLQNEGEQYLSDLCRKAGF